MAEIAADKSEYAVTSIRTVSGCAARTFSHRSMPLMPGMRWSAISTATSRSCTSSFSASSPLRAVTTSYSGSTMARKASKFARSSSTYRTTARCSVVGLSVCVSEAAPGEPASAVAVALAAGSGAAALPEVADVTTGGCAALLAAAGGPAGRFFPSLCGVLLTRRLLAGLHPAAGWSD